MKFWATVLGLEIFGNFVRVLQNVTKYRHEFDQVTGNIEHGIRTRGGYAKLDCFILKSFPYDEQRIEPFWLFCV